MGLFDELDIAGAKDNPWEIPDDTYLCVISNLEVKQNSAGNMGMYLTFTIREGEYAGMEISDYKRVPHKDDKDKLTGKKYEDAKSFIKMRLESLGVPESRMNSVTKEELVGTECYVSSIVRRNGDSMFINVREVNLTRPMAGDKDSDTIYSVTGQEAVNPFA